MENRRNVVLKTFFKEKGVRIGSIAGNGDCFLQSIIAGIKVHEASFPLTSAHLRSIVVKMFTENLNEE